MHVRAQRPGHVLAQQCADGAAIHATHHLAHQEAEGVDVIAMRRPRRPPRLGAGSASVITVQSSIAPGGNCSCSDGNPD
jgi:hypothetical protein